MGTVNLVALLVAGLLSPAFLSYGGPGRGLRLMRLFGGHGGHVAHCGQADGGGFDGSGSSSPLR